MDIDVSTLPITYSATIPESYRDVMGHMNVMWYTHLFDNAVFGAFDLLGMTQDYMEVNQAGGFALESHTRYLSEVRIGHKVRVHTRILGRSEKRFHMMNFMWNDSKGDLAATFEVVGAHIDMKVRRMAPMPSEVHAKLDEIISKHQRLAWEPPICGSMRA